MRLVPAFLLFSALGYAEVIYGCSGSIAHIAAGGGIQTTFTITNIGDSAASYQLFFWDNDGPLTLVTDAGTISSFFEVVFPPHTSRTIRTTGPADTMIQGWATIGFIGSVGVSATYRFSTAPWAGSETTVPVDTWRNNRFFLAFDHTDSGTTGLAIANPYVLKDHIAVTMTFRGEDGGVIVADTFNLSQGTHRAILTTSSYPATAGRRGTIDIATASGYMSVLGLHFGPTAVSAITPLVSGQWASFDNSSAGCWDY